MFDNQVRNFFQTHLRETTPQLPETFEIILFNPATFQGKGGIKVLQLKTLFKKATIEVKFRKVENTLSTNLNHLGFMGVNNTQC